MSLFTFWRFSSHFEGFQLKLERFVFNLGFFAQSAILFTFQGVKIVAYFFKSTKLHFPQEIPLFTFSSWNLHLSTHPKHLFTYPISAESFATPCISSKSRISLESLNLEFSEEARKRLNSEHQEEEIAINVTQQ